MKIPPMKLGVVGQPSSGKDTVSNYLEKHHGFTHFSSGDFFRQHARKQNLELTRPILQKVANDLRKKHGPDYAMRHALKIKTDHLVISGTRNVADAEALKKAGGKLIAVEAPLDKRYKRALGRKRASDKLTLAEFQQQQESEHANALAHVQNVGAVISLADYIVSNDGTLEDLYGQIDKLLEKIANEIS